MVNDKIQAVILAAGKSARFNTGGSKLVERICGKEMIVHTTGLLEHMNITTTLIVGHKKELVQEAIQTHHPQTTFTFITQHEQLGTGHALACSKSSWSKDHILVLNGDTPLLTQELVQNLINTHLENKAAISLVVAPNVDSSVRGYGHIIKEKKGIKIVEDRHMNHEKLETSTLNAGIYLFKKSFLLQHIDNLPRNNVSGEYYLTDLIEIASKKKLGVCTVDAAFDTIRGVNTFKELWVAEHLKRAHIIEHWMSLGVRFSTPQSVHIDESVRIDPGCYIGSGAQLFGKTHIGENSSIGAYSVLKNTLIGKHAKVRSHVIIQDSTIGENCTINSFSYIHQNSCIPNDSTVESFSELCNTTHLNTQQKVSVRKKKEKTFVAAFKVAADRTLSEGA